MKKWNLLLVMCLTLSLSVSVRGQDVNEPYEAGTFWLFAEPNFDSENNTIGTWIGYRKDLSEFGIAGQWRMYTESETPDDTESRFALGFYALRHFPDILTSIENNFWPAELTPEGMTAEPAIGFEFLFDIEGEGFSFAPVAGLKLFENFCIQYQYDFFSGETQAEDSGKFGINITGEF